MKCKQIFHSGVELVVHVSHPIPQHLSPYQPPHSSMNFETPTSLTNTNIMALPESTNTTDIDALHLLDDPTSVDKYLIDSYQRNQSIQNPAYTTLIAVYGCLSVLGAVGNILVVLVVARKPAMRTARNMFIVNLAVSGECFWMGAIFAYDELVSTIRLIRQLCQQTR